jgi:hypothetical protein
MQPTEVRAEKPRIPAVTRAQERAAEEQQDYLREREGLESRSVLRGLIVLALLVLLASMMRAGFGRVFVHGWWRP